MSLRITVLVLMIALTHGQWPVRRQPNYQTYQPYQVENCQNICATLQQRQNPICANDRGVLRQFSSICELAMYNCETSQMLVGTPGICSLSVG